MIASDCIGVVGRFVVEGPCFETEGSRRQDNMGGSTQLGFRQEQGCEHNMLCHTLPQGAHNP